jgi:aminomethyltransferase
MAAFSGYDMPLWYASARKEHLAVLTRAGVFDTSHMAAVAVDGPGAFDLLQFCFTNNLAACRGRRRAPLVPGRAVYGAFLNAAGHVIDDAIVFMMADDAFCVVVNAGMGPRIADHLRAHRRDPGATVRDLSGQFGKLDLQGPLAARLLQLVLADPGQVFEDMPYFAFKGGFSPRVPARERVATRRGLPLLLSRTGYTGEFGFELFTSRECAAALWEEIMAAGEELGAEPCGLAARDSLRTGAVLPLSHQDIGAWPFCRHPWSFALPYADGQRGFTKNFLGSDALVDGTGPYTYPFVGRDLRKVTLPASVRDASQQPVGDVLTCVTDMAIGWHAGRLYSIASPDRPADFLARGLSCGFVRVPRALPPGTRLTLTDNRRRIAVEVVRDIRPDRTARQPIKTFLLPKEE